MCIRDSNEKVDSLASRGRLMRGSFDALLAFLAKKEAQLLEATALGHEVGLQVLRACARLTADPLQKAK
eukprot:12045018-Alexandrium_andersonii.AAC.1